MRESAARAVERIRNVIRVALIVTATAFALYTGASGPFEPAIQRVFFVFVLMPLLFLTVPSGLLRDRTLETASGLALGAITMVVMGWALLNYERLAFDPFISVFDTSVGLVGLALVLESVRRTIGLPLTILLLAFLVFAYFGESVPVPVLQHGGLNLEAIASLIFYGTDGVFGAPVGVTSTFIVVIIMLGAFLTSTGGAELFMNLAKILAGRFVGGPAKIAVVGSGLMGMITGATVANVATTGSVTIPMMKRSGYDPRFAGAVEALASSGGQLMPPIMGAAAFIMIDFLNINYGALLGHAIIPALLYFFSVFMIIHVRSVKHRLHPVPKAEIPSLWTELLERGHMLIPIAVLIVLLIERYGIMYVAFLSVVSAMVVCALRPSSRLSLRGYYRTFAAAMEAMVPLVAITAGAGIMIGTLAATGLNLKITYLIELVGQGHLFVTLFVTMIACLVLGMGLPTVAAYIVLGTLVPGSLTNLGVPPVAAHLFIFYFAILSAITPPVCTGAYVAAGIAGTDPIQTGFAAIRLGIVVFLLPYAFVYDPSLLMLGGDVWTGVVHMLTCAIGIVFWAFGLEGYVRWPIGPLARVVLLVSGGLLIWPDPLVSLAGLVAGGGSLLAMFVLKRSGQTGEGEVRPSRGIEVK